VHILRVTLPPTHINTFILAPCTCILGECYCFGCFRFSLVAL